MCCLGEMGVTAEECRLQSYNMQVFAPGSLKPYQNQSTAHGFMVGSGKVFAREAEDCFCGSLLSRFGVSMLGKERQAPVEPWMIICSHHGALPP